MASSYSGTFTVDASSAAFRVASKALLIIGDDDGANFGSGTVTLQVKTDQGWASSASTYSAADVDTIDLGSPAICRLTLAGSTSPDLNWYVRE